MKSAAPSTQNPLKEIANPDMGALFKELSSSPEGLNATEAKQRLEKYGPNALEEKKQNYLKKAEKKEIRNVD